MVNEFVSTSKKILVYDDDPEILLLCKAILANYKFKAETLPKCDNILEDITTIEPDLILMDLWIPEIGGEEAVRRLKNDKSGKEIPVLLFSANPDIAEICAKVKADGYIEKPFSIRFFIDKINSVI